MPMHVPQHEWGDPALPFPSSRSQQLETCRWEEGLCLLPEVTTAKLLGEEILDMLLLP